MAFARRIPSPPLLIPVFGEVARFPDQPDDGSLHEWRTKAVLTKAQAWIMPPGTHKNEEEVESMIHEEAS
jgi:hypothetical protein